MNHPFTTRTKNPFPNVDLQVSVHDQQRAWNGSGIKNRLIFFLAACMFSSQAFAQTTTTFPPASSCSSKDLLLVGATLPGTGLCNNCTTGDSVYRTLNLTINNKTGSTRTGFAFWGTLVIRNSDGTLSSSRAIQGCGGPVASNANTTLLFNQIGYKCGQSLTIKNLFLAWTDASKGSTCASLNSATINPKCGTLDSIQINTGLDASFIVTNATCAVPGAINMTPLGGKSPYSYSWVASEGGVVPANQTTNEDLTGLVAGKYTVTITDALNCTSTRFTTVTASAPVTAEAGDPFTKTCTSNASGKQIGEATAAGFTYSWSPTDGLSASNVSNPTANPSSTTIYTVTKTNTASGCSNTDQVTVTVDNAAVVANAGPPFTKTCTSNINGKEIGEATAAGFTYSWSPATGLSATNVSNPTANPSSTTIYTVTKTKTSTGCNNTAQVTVTVDNATVVANAGDDFTKTCVSNASGKQIGVAAEAGFTYSWSPATGLSDANVSNPNANPASTTTYTVTKTKTSSGCTDTDEMTVTVDNATVAANAGDDFTKTCVSNASGKLIGVAAEAGFTYSWSPATGLSDANVSNPNANPASTTTYTVTKTKTSSGCTDTDEVTVTVNNAAVVANAGDDFTKTCVSNASGKQIGVASEAGFTYSWSPATGLSDANISNPTANPGSTTAYTVTKTNTSSGCSNTDNVTVTVNTNAPAAPTVCVVQPSLCGPAKGSITILSPLGADYEYSIDNGANWQASAAFNNLDAGSVTGIKVKKLSSGCTSTAVSCNASDCSQSGARLITSTQDQTPLLINKVENQTTVKAFPNPFNDNVKFVVTASEAGKASLEVFNLLGQKVKTVFQGHIRAGANMFQVNMPSMRSAQFMYVLRVGDKKVTGKLLQLNQ